MPLNKGVSTPEHPFPTLLILAKTIWVRAGEIYFVIWVESYIKYALTVNPTIYVSCIKQFWNTFAVKQSNNVTRLQALVDRKKVVITEAAIRDVLSLDDAEGVDCLPNEEILAELARMGYEKPSTKLTFYKDFSSSQWKFLIHTILQSMSAKRTSWNEFILAMASAVICLSTVSAASATIAAVPAATITAAPVRVVVASIKRRKGVFIMDLGEKSTAKTPAETKSKDNGKGIMVEEPKPMKKKQQSKEQIEEEDNRAIESINETPAQKAAKKRKLNEEVKDLKQHLEIVPDEDDDMYTEATPLARKVAGDEQVMGRQVEIYQIDMDHALKVLSMQEDEPEVQEAVEVVTTAKLITEVVATVSKSVSAASATIAAVSAATITAAPNRAIESINETPAQKAAKRRKLNEEVKDLKQHLEIVPDEDDDMYTEATPLARKVIKGDHRFCVNISINHLIYISRIDHSKS
nr:xylulose kinase-1 [Tanacetum cinerariifolium]